MLAIYCCADISKIVEFLEVLLLKLPVFLSACPV